MPNDWGIRAIGKSRVSSGVKSVKEVMLDKPKKAVKKKLTAMELRQKRIDDEIRARRRRRKVDGGYIEYDLLDKKAELVKVNKLLYFDPYSWQVDFINSHSSEIALRAANQIGKTMSGTAWDAMDLTGIYPPWFNGIRYSHPITLVVGCINNDKTRDILQKELFGDPIEWEKELGTGWIPKYCIGKIQKKRGVPDAFYNVRIKHHDDSGNFDGWSKVVFLAYEMGGATWMAHKADITHLDEECPMDILQQAARSGIATGGRIRVTFTPENGVTNVVKLVENDYELHTAEWSDVAGDDFTYTTKSGKEYKFESVRTLKGRKGHLTADKIRSAAKKIPEHDLDKRMRGIPVLGSGLVFRFPEEQFKVEGMDFPDHFEYIDGIDFGGISSSSHPTAYARAAYDPINDKIIIYDGFKLQGKEIPEVAAHIIMKQNSDIVPVVWPHDGHKLGSGGQTTSDKYISAGVNMYVNTDLPEKSHATHKPIESQKEGQGGNKIIPGIDEISLRINDGRLVVVDTVLEFWEEYRIYHMKDGKIVDRDDDFLAAVRYIVMMIRHCVSLNSEKVIFNQTKSIGSGSWMGG